MITDFQKAIVAEFRKNVEVHTTDKDGVEWGSVYIDNGRPTGMSGHEYAGHLSRLTTAGLYRPDTSDESHCFGFVRLKDPAPTKPLNQRQVRLMFGAVRGQPVANPMDVHGAGRVRKSDLDYYRDVMDLERRGLIVKDEPGFFHATAWKELQSLALQATTLEWGSEEQIAAQDTFFNRVKTLVPTDKFEDLEAYCHKATTEEMIAAGFATVLADNHNFRKEGR